MWTKTTSEKANFCSQTPFSRRFLFRRDQNNYSNLTSKIMKMCEQILKKRQCPNTIQILWIVKNKRRSMIASAIVLKLLIHTLSSVKKPQFDEKSTKMLYICRKWLYMGQHINMFSMSACELKRFLFEPLKNISKFSTKFLKLIWFISRLLYFVF